MKRLIYALTLVVALTQIAWGQNKAKSEKAKDKKKEIDFKKDFQSSTPNELLDLQYIQNKKQTNRSSNFPFSEFSTDSTPLFDAVHDYQVLGGGPSILVSGDFNNDTKIDIAVSGFTSPYLFTGRGNGTFQNSGALPIAARVAGDFNQDGNLDIADNVASISLGNGNGTFQSPSTAMVSNGINAATGDFNKDGKLDLAISTDTTVAILLGNGDGTLQAPVSYSLGGSEPNAISIGDFNNDSNLDLAIVCNNGTISIKLGNGYGSFVSGTTLASGYNSKDIKTADFNNDGKLDLATVTYGNTYGVFVYLGNGDGTFQSPNSFIGNTYDWSLTTEDINSDGNTDIIIPGCRILFGNGTGSFPTSASYSAGFGYVSGVVAEDFNGDGKIDIAVGTMSSFNDIGFFSVLINKGDCTFPAATKYNVGSNPESVVTQDFNKDGNLDIATSNYDGNTLSVLLGNGNGTFQLKADYPTGTNPSSIISNDFNKDGEIDLVVVNHGSGSISVFTGNGDGTFNGGGGV